MATFTVTTLDDIFDAVTAIHPLTTGITENQDFYDCDTPGNIHKDGNATREDILWNVINFRNCPMEFTYRSDREYHWSNAWQLTIHAGDEGEYNDYVFTSDKF